METTERLLAPIPQRSVPPDASFDVFTRLLLDAMHELRAGNFDVRMPTDLLGMPGRIADVFNDIAALNAQRAREIARVSRMVGREGQVKERIIVAPGLGARTDEINALNMLIDDLVWPTTEITRAI